MTVSAERGAVAAIALPEAGEQPVRVRRRRTAPSPALMLAVVLLVAWQIAADTGRISKLFFSSPSDVVQVGYHAVQTRTFWHDVWVSTTEFVVGYSLAVVVAIPLGLAIGWFPRVGYFFGPWLNAANSLPRIALLPLVILWCGLGFQSKVVIVFIGVLVAVTVNTIGGVRTVDRALIDVGTSYNASALRRLRTIVLPSSLPFVLVGMRLGVGSGVGGVIVAEHFTSRAGLGHYIFRSAITLQTDKVLFGALFVTLLALLAFYGVARVEKRFNNWRPRVGSAVGIDSSAGRT